MSELIPSYTVYNNPCFAKFISEYFQKALYKLEIRDENHFFLELNWIRMGKEFIALPFASALGLMDLPAHLPERLLHPFMNAAVEQFVKGKEMKLQFPEILRAIRKKDFGNSSSKWQLRSLIPASPHKHTGKCIHYLFLKLQEDQIFASFSSNLRRKIRKAGKNDLHIKTGGRELDADFYKVYTANCTRLGSPVLKMDFYSRLAASYGNSARFFIVYLDKKAVGAALLLGYQKQWECIYFATLADYNHLYTSYLLNWEMIRFAAENSAECFSFGRSDTGSGVDLYKEQWGAVKFDIYWNYSHERKFNIRRYKSLAAATWPFIPAIIREKAGPYLAKRIY